MLTGLIKQGTRWKKTCCVSEYKHGRWNIKIPVYCEYFGYYRYQIVFCLIEMETLSALLALHGDLKRHGAHVMSLWGAFGRHQLSSWRQWSLFPNFLWSKDIPWLRDMFIVCLEFVHVQFNNQLTQPVINSHKSEMYYHVKFVITETRGLLLCQLCGIAKLAWLQPSGFNVGKIIIQRFRWQMLRIYCHYSTWRPQYMSQYPYIFRVNSSGQKVISNIFINYPNIPARS